jgi:hypothetical protein
MQIVHEAHLRPIKQRRKFAPMDRFHRMLVPHYFLTALASLAVPATIDAQVTERHIDWSNLRPKGQGKENAIFPGAASSRAQGETLSEDLAGAVVRIAGYVLPIDREQDLVYEFLLVPWLGACSHAPQPPPNQMVHVIPSVPFRIARAYDFVSVTGTLRPELERPSCSSWTDLPC